jgi:putative serine protease PepD
MQRERLWSGGPAPEEGEPTRELSPLPRLPGADPAPEDAEERRSRLVPALLSALAGAVVVGLVLLVLGVRFGDDDPEPLSAQAGRLAQSEVGRIYAQASRGVVSIAAQQGSDQSTGTGFLIDRAGTIVTNAHVVGEAGTVQVRFGDQGRTLDAPVLGRDPSSDLAVARVDPSQAGRLFPLPLADSSRVRVGDTAIAIGNPFGLDRTATAGIVSGLGRNIQAPNGFNIDEVIQTDAPINPGNSGGPLIDAKGRVIGVNSQIETTSGGNVGIGFAVPSNTVREVVPRLQTGQPIVRPFLGVSTGPVSQSAARDRGMGTAKGALVQDVTPNGPADDAGVRKGDVIVGVGGRAVDDPSDVAQAIEDRQPGEPVVIDVIRPDGSRASLRGELGRRPRTP